MIRKKGTFSVPGAL